MLANTDQTIVAIASAHGSAARGVVRVSGPDTWRLAKRIFQDAEDTPPQDWSPFTCRRGVVCLPDAGSVPAECYIFRAPASYTRQDSMEIHTVGSPPLLHMIVSALVALGAREAQPGEFTARAFLAGGIDLSQAEAVAATILAQSDAELRAARALREGELDRTIRALADRLTDLLALVEADIDFAEEPIQFIAGDSLARQLAGIGDELTRIVQVALDAERFGATPCVLLIGEPNAGKSTLMNRLSGLDRAACSPLPGATRDVLSAAVKLQHGEVTLLDAAGLAGESPYAVLKDFATGTSLERAAEGTSGASCVGSAPRPEDTHDQVSPEAAAAAATRRAALRADVACLVIDASDSIRLPSPIRFENGQHGIVILNKIDLVSEQARASLLADAARIGAGRPIAVSALTGANVEALRSRLDALLFQDEPTGADRVALTSRQRESLLAAAASVRRAQRCAAHSNDMLNVVDLVASDLHDACRHLAHVTGEITTDDLLDRVFSQFCIGK